MVCFVSVNKLSGKELAFLHSRGYKSSDVVNRPRSGVVNVLLGRDSLFGLRGWPAMKDIRGLVWEYGGGLCTPTYSIKESLESEDKFKALVLDINRLRDPNFRVSAHPEGVSWRFAEPEEIKGLYIADVETISLQASTYSILHVGFIRPGEKEVLVVERKKLNDIQWKDVKCIWHNAIFDLKHLRANLAQKHPLPELVGDTMIMSYLLVENRIGHGLKSLAQFYCYAPAYGGEIKSLLKKGGTMLDLDERTYFEYLMWDVYYTSQLYEHFRVMRYPQTVYNIMLELTVILAQSELRGVKVDVEHLANYELELKTELTRLEEQLKSTSGIKNLNSPVQISTYLYGKRGGKTDEKTLKTLNENEFARRLLEYRAVNKNLNVYCRNLKRNLDPAGFIHPHFMLTTTVTGRMTITSPPLQTFSKYNKKLVNCIIARPGYKLAMIDYSQLEVRVAAWLSGDNELKRALREPVVIRDVDAVVRKEIYKTEWATGKDEEGNLLFAPDFHTQAACAAFRTTPEQLTNEQRQAFKRIIFGLLYGRGVRSLWENELNNLTINEVMAYVDGVWNAFPRLARWLHVQPIKARQEGYLENPYGRRRRFWLNNDKIKRQAANFMVQSTASEICQEALVNVSKFINPLGGHVLFAVYDSLMLELPVHNFDNVVRECLEIMRKPSLEDREVLWECDAEVGLKWGELKPVLL